MSDGDFIQCIECKKREANADHTWPKGWGCLWGTFACCSRSCAAKFASENAVDEHTVLRDDDYDED